MASNCVPCSCPPDVVYSNVCCCPAQFGISVMQPACQRLAAPCGSGGPTVVNNPCYCSSSDRSTWTYKFFTDCIPGTAASAISHFLIPICEDIPQANVTVEERVDGCTDFYPVAFTVTNKDGNPPNNFGQAPEGFNWLKVENDNPKRYDKGVCVEYRITILGNYPAVNQAIRVKAGQNLLTFCGADPCFLVPGCLEPGQLNVEKECELRIANNMAALHYQVTVSNTGGQPLSNVQFNDVISFNDTNLDLGDPVITPAPPLGFTRGTGTITISGNIGTVVPGTPFVATYDIAVTNITEPGSYTISNRAEAVAAGTSDSDTCSLTLNVVRVSVSKCCNPVVNGNEVTFVVTISSVGNSPSTTVNVIDQMIIPAGVTAAFNVNSFNGCTATFGDNGQPVPTNGTPVTGPRIINIVCNNINIPAGGNVQKNIRFTVVSTSAFQSPAIISNTVQQVTGTNPNQIYLPPVGVPAAASVSVSANVVCNTSCL